MYPRIRWSVRRSVIRFFRKSKTKSWKTRSPLLFWKSKTKSCKTCRRTHRCTAGTCWNERCMMPNFLHRWKLFFKENKRDKCLNAHPLLDLLIQSFNYKNLFLNINLNNHANRIVSLVSVLDKRHHKTRPVGQRCDLKCVWLLFASLSEYDWLMISYWLE